MPAGTTPNWDAFAKHPGRASTIPLQTQGVQAWDRYAYVNNNPLKYTDPSGHIGVLALLLHPAVVVVVAVVAVALIVNNILPGRDERIATTANAIESGIAWASNKLKPRYQKPNKREQQQDDIKWNLENPSIGGGSHDNPSPIGEACKKNPVACFITGSVILHSIFLGVSTGGYGQDESNSYGNLPSEQPTMPPQQCVIPTIGPVPSHAPIIAPSISTRSNPAERPLWIGGGGIGKPVMR